MLLFSCDHELVVLDAVHVLQCGLKDVLVLCRRQLSTHSLTNLSVGDEVRVFLSSTLLALQILVDVLQNYLLLLQTELLFCEMLWVSHLQP